jgi:hypothetical protein
MPALVHLKRRLFQALQVIGNALCIAIGTAAVRAGN